MENNAPVEIEGGNDPQKVQGKYELELFFSDDRIFLNYWDYMRGQDACVQIKGDKLFQFVHSAAEVEESEIEGKEIGDVFEQKEISLPEFIEQIKDSIIAAQSINPTK